MTLPKATASGYGSRELPAEYLARADARRGDDRPTLLWFSRLDDAENEKLETIVFKDEPLGLSLKQFRCLRIDVETVEDPKLREQYGKVTPMFVAFDPKGQVLGSVAGRKATSLSSMKKLVQRTWSKVYETRNRAFCKEMKDILDRIDLVAGRRTTLQSKLERYEAKGNARKVAGVKEELAELDADDAEILKDEKEIREGCELRDEFRPEEESGE